MDDETRVSLAIDQIKATNRTTHAIRALTKFIVFEAAYLLIAGFFIAIGTAPVFSLEEPNQFLIVFGALIALAGLLHSLVSAFQELKESEIPKVYIPRINRTPSPIIRKDSKDYFDDDALTRRAWAEKEKTRRIYGDAE